MTPCNGCGTGVPFDVHAEELGYCPECQAKYFAHSEETHDCSWSCIAEPMRGRWVLFGTIVDAGHHVEVQVDQFLRVEWVAGDDDEVQDGAERIMTRDDLHGWLVPDLTDREFVYV